MTKLPPFSNPTTSRNAAIQFYGKVNKTQQRVLDAILQHGITVTLTIPGHPPLQSKAMSNEMIGAATGLTQNTVQPRTWELRKLCRLMDSGERRNTVAGNPAILWAIVPPGITPPQQLVVPKSTRTAARILHDLMVMRVITFDRERSLWRVMGGCPISDAAMLRAFGKTVVPAAQVGQLDRLT